MDGIWNSIPGIGHFKGLVHYAAGDTAAGNRAMYEATRSTAVIVGGVAGIPGGPAGMAAGAALAGAATDAVSSVVAQEPLGVVAGVTDIATDVSNFEIPIRSTVRTAFQVGADVVGGIAGPALGKVTIVAKSAGKGVVVKVGATAVQKMTAGVLVNGLSRSLVTEGPERSACCQSTSKSSSSFKNTGSSGNSSSKSSSTGGNSKSSGTASGSGGGKPPDKNNDKKDNKNNKDPPKSHWDRFLEIFNKIKLDDILIHGVYIFRGIEDWDKDELKKLIVTINNRYKHLDLAHIVNITIALLSQVPRDQVTVHNFVNLAKFVLAYLCQELTEQNESLRVLWQPFNESRAEHAQRITLENINTSSSIVNVFRQLMIEIGLLVSMTNPRFVNTIAAVYHYYKHKFIAHTNRFYTPAEYIGLGQEGLIRLRSLPRYQRLVASGVTTIIYRRYDAAIGRRLKIVIKFFEGNWKLSSLYYEDDIYDGDEDGDEWVNDEKI